MKNGRPPGADRLIQWIAARKSWTVLVSFVTALITHRRFSYLPRPSGILRTRAMTHNSRPARKKRMLTPPSGEIQRRPIWIADHVVPQIRHSNTYTATIRPGPGRRTVGGVSTTLLP